MPLDFPSSPTNGQSYAGYVYDSSLPGWRNVNSDYGVQSLSTMGLRNVVPASVGVSSGSATFTQNGQVSFSGVGTLNLNNVFSSAYDWYQINLAMSGASVADTNIQARLRVSGADSSVSYYEGGSLQSGASVSAVNNLNQTLWNLGRTQAATSPAGHMALNFKVFKPFLAHPTTMFTESISWNGSATVTFRFGGFHNVQTSYTGITLFATSGTFDGIIQVYGFND